MALALEAVDELEGVNTVTRAPFEAQPSRWSAEMKLNFDLEGKRTEMRRWHRGPLMVQRPFHPEADGTCHVYLLHQPGGIAGGDQLDFSHTIGPRARALMTTPGATKFYRASHSRSTHSTRIDIGAGGVCEYLPAETIVFDGADGVVDVDVTLSDGATYIGWDVVSLGRPAACERLLRGLFRQRTKISRNGRPLWFEQLKLIGGSDTMTARHALHARPVVGTMIAAGAIAEDTAQILRDALGLGASDGISVSQLDEVLVCRFLGAKTSTAKAIFSDVWSILRKQLQRKTAIEPRIWAT